MKNTTVLCILLAFIRLNQSAKILGYFTTASYSHQIIYQALWEVLALRGHNVTVVSSNILNNASICNLKEIDVHNVYDVYKQIDFVGVLSRHASSFDRSFGYLTIVRKTNEIALENKEVKELIRGNYSFDILLMAPLHPLSFALQTKFRVPIIGEFFLIFVLN